ncbi:hypothetical protein N665_0233s0020 [Sinapis alba]|nr:hypothetical protein N665_0233s0020 [Sinapis alba]
MRYATYIYISLAKIHYLCFIFLILTYVQALDVGVWKCPKGIVKYTIEGRCVNSKNPDCELTKYVTNCFCVAINDQKGRRSTCYCCKVKS